MASSIRLGSKTTQSQTHRLSVLLSQPMKNLSENNFSKWMRNLLLVARRTLVATGLLLTATTAEPLGGVP